ncbi:MAG TPA: carbonic anhydrase, partial [Acidimicrobiales bacterium]
MFGPFDDLLDANRRNRESFRFGDLTGTPRLKLAVLACMDTRIDPLAVLGLQPGDAKILRNAGARVTDDVVRSLAV